MPADGSPAQRARRGFVIGELLIALLLLAVAVSSLAALMCSVSRRSTTPNAVHAQRMKPRSGLSRAFSAFCFFASSAIDAESVRAFTTVPPELSPVTTVSLHSRWS